MGRLFLDFATGTTIQLTGRARILWEREQFAGLKGAERAVAVEIDETVEIAGLGPVVSQFEIRESPGR